MSSNEKKYQKFEENLIRIYLLTSTLEKPLFPLQLWYSFTVPSTSVESLLTFPVVRPHYELQYFAQEFFCKINPMMLDHLIKTQRCKPHKSSENTYVYSLRVLEITPLEKVRILSVR